MGLLDDVRLFIFDAVNSMQENVTMALVDMKNELLSKLASWSLGMGGIICDLICVGILVYSCVVAFKIMSDGVFSEDAPNKLIDQTFYLGIGYFIARVFSNILPILK